MANETNRNFQHQQPKPTDASDASKKNQTDESGQHQPNQQDPSKRNPSHVDDSRNRDGEGSEQGEKRRAS